MSGAPKEEKKSEEAAEGAKPAGGGRKLAPMLAAVAVVLALQAALAVGIMRYLGVSDRATKTAGHAAHKEGEIDSADGEAHADGGEEEEEEDEDSGEKKKPKKLECVEKPLSKTVTIAGTEAKRYLKAAFCLEYDAAKYKDLAKQIEPQMMRVEASVNKILSSATFEMVNSPAVQDSLTRQMTKDINKMLKHEKMQLNAVLVTEWLVQ
jgi:flagellar basal body-associated protein FliL